MTEASAVLVTGAAGEIGTCLIHELSSLGVTDIVAADCREFTTDVNATIKIGDISDPQFIKELQEEFSFSQIFHLAALLSSAGEKNPMLAHRVNVEGSLLLLELARTHGKAARTPVRFLFPSTIAVYGCTPSHKLDVTEDQCLAPITMYGANKLYVENLGRYFSDHYQSLNQNAPNSGCVDFRSIRFPAILSAETLPTGGTSDYASEMVHAAIKQESYECFVSPDTTLPFIMMPDAVRALILLASADQKALSQRIYNISAFSISAGQIKAQLEEYYNNRHFKTAPITFKPHSARQRIVDSWPSTLNDAAARHDWGWHPQHSGAAALPNYLFPRVQEFYRTSLHQQSRQKVAAAG